MKLRAILRLRNEHILARRRELGLTQVELSRAAGVPKQLVGHLERLHYGYIEKGKWTRRWAAHHIQAVADYLGLTFEQVAPAAVWERPDPVETRYEVVADIDPARLGGVRSLLGAGSLSVDPAEQAIENEAMAALQEIVAGLEPRLGQALELHRQGKTLAEIGRTLDVTRERARQIVLKAERTVEYRARGKGIIE